MNPTRFLGDSLKPLPEFPKDAPQNPGYPLAKVQPGEQPEGFKPIPFIGKDVEKLRVWDGSGTDRVI